MTIVPALRVGMQFVTLCVTRRFCGVRGIGVRLRSALIIVPTLCVGMQFVTLCVTRRFCGVRGIGVRLRSAFRPSASYFDRAKVTKPPDQRQGSAVNDVALCVVSTIAVKALSGAVSTGRAMSRTLNRRGSSDQFRPSLPRRVDRSSARVLTGPTSALRSFSLTLS
ncbi:hypothetical protein F4W67_15150 [Pseudomonas caricapapayae]|nr:hypothetical protein F4W67_15150 [Pseudomonas caricapapayae]